MDWFERLTGFRESDYTATQARLRVENGRLHSDARDRTYGVGVLELVSLQELRLRRVNGGGGKLRLSLVSGDARELHCRPEHARALFQVASQFNMLEMTGPSVTPEDGVTRYQHDRTQGPACAIAAGAATIYRNYFAPVGDQIGQTAKRQLDGLADLGVALSELTSIPVADLWLMENGYALATTRGLDAISSALSSQSQDGIDRLRGRLRIGLHADVEVTDTAERHDQRVSQAFCSALPLGYSREDRKAWEPFARLVLEAAYEATMLCAVVNAARGGSKRVSLTLIGAGAFGNPQGWVLDAMKRALALFRDADLDVSIVSYGAPPPELMRLAAEFEAGL